MPSTAQAQPCSGGQLRHGDSADDGNAAVGDVVCTTQLQVFDTASETRARTAPALTIGVVNSIGTAGNLPITQVAGNSTANATLSAAAAGAVENR
jgi:hypothetical protein